MKCVIKHIPDRRQDLAHVPFLVQMVDPDTGALHAQARLSLEGIDRLSQEILAAFQSYELEAAAPSDHAAVQIAQNPRGGFSLWLRDLLRPIGNFPSEADARTAARRAGLRLEEYSERPPAATAQCKR